MCQSHCARLSVSHSHSKESKLYFDTYWHFGATVQSYHRAKMISCVYDCVVDVQIYTELVTKPNKLHYHLNNFRMWTTTGSNCILLWNEDFFLENWDISFFGHFIVFVLFENINFDRSWMLHMHRYMWSYLRKFTFSRIVTNKWIKNRTLNKKFGKRK